MKEKLIFLQMDEECMDRFKKAREEALNKARLHRKMVWEHGEE